MEHRNMLISKEKIWQALRWELEYGEMHDLFNEINTSLCFDMVDYFDLEMMLDKIHRYMQGEKPREYFMTWCLILMNCFMGCEIFKSNAMNTIYSDMGNFFDTFVYNDGTLLECKELIARLKWYDHCRKNILRKKNKDFVTNGVITYVSKSKTTYDFENYFLQV